MLFKTSFKNDVFKYNYLWHHMLFDQCFSKPLQRFTLKLSSNWNWHKVKSKTNFHYNPLGGYSVPYCKYTLNDNAIQMMEFDTAYRGYSQKPRSASCNNKVLKYQKESIKSYFTTIQQHDTYFLVLIYSTQVFLTFVRVELMILWVIHQDIKLLFSIMLVLIEKKAFANSWFLLTHLHIQSMDCKNSYHSYTHFQTIFRRLAGDI